MTSLPEKDSKRGLALVKNALTISAGFVLLRFLLTPIRIRVLTELLEPGDYGMVTLLTMSAHGMALIVSLGGFEYWLRVLPSAPETLRVHYLWRVVRVSSIIGILLCAGIALGWGPPAWYGDGKVQLSGAVVAVLFALVLHVQQRLYYLLGTQSHLRARVTQLLWSDLWYLFLIPFGAGMIWSAERVLWIWALWMLALSLVTFTWVPLGKAFRSRKSDPGVSPWIRLSLPILPILLSEWIFRLSGQYVLLEATGAHTMALYGLALNLSLVGYAAGVPLIDVCITNFNARYTSKAEGGIPEELAVIFSKAFRLVLVICLPVALALLLLSTPLLKLLASSAFSGAADYLPWAAPVPFLMLTALLFGRLAMSFSKTHFACIAGLTGGLLTLILSVLWVTPYGVNGVFLAVHAGLGLCNLILFFSLQLTRWFRTSALGLISLFFGTCVLVLLFYGIRQLTWPALILLGLAGCATLAVAVLFRWITPADLKLFEAPPTRSEISLE